MLTVTDLNEFYVEQEIFITGATGLIGKSLVYKLLKSFPKVTKIFILLREKRGKSLKSRLDDYKNHIVFDLIRKENPDDLNKITCIRGDISKIQLGISDEDLELIKNVSIIFHVAATVRFDEPLKRSLHVNVRGTLEALRIAEKLKNLKMFAHVSTAYSNPYETVIKEELYPPCGDWKVILNAVEKFDDNILDALWIKMSSGKFPNTYTFSKHLAEYVVNSYKDRLPVLVYRPSVVTNAYLEPYPGWYDGVNGVNGLVAAIASGVARVLYCRPKNIIDIVPVDATALFLITAAWRETIYPPLKPDENVRVYTLASSNYSPETMENSLNITIKLFHEIPVKKCIWVPRITYTSNYWYFLLNFYIFQLLPALFLDGLIKLSGNRPALLHIQRKYISSIKILNFFMLNDYKFENEKLNELFEFLRINELYPFNQLLVMPLEEIFRCGALGTRKFVLKESPDNIKSAKFQFQILKWLDISIRWMFYYWIARRVISYFQAHYYF